MLNLTQNHRSSPRKPLHTHGTLAVGKSTIPFATVDIGSAGVCLVVPCHMEIGQRCHIDLTLTAKAHQYEISAIVKVTYCLNSKDGFRVGMQFVDLINKANQNAITQYLES